MYERLFGSSRYISECHVNVVRRTMLPLQVGRGTHTSSLSVRNYPRPPPIPLSRAICLTMSILDCSSSWSKCGRECLSAQTSVRFDSILHITYSNRKVSHVFHSNELNLELSFLPQAHDSWRKAYVPSLCHSALILTCTLVLVELLFSRQPIWRRLWPECMIRSMSCSRRRHLPHPPKMKWQKLPRYRQFRASPPNVNSSLWLSQTMQKELSIASIDETFCSAVAKGVGSVSSKIWLYSWLPNGLSLNDLTLLSVDNQVVLCQVWSHANHRPQTSFCIDMTTVPIVIQSPQLRFLSVPQIADGVNGVQCNMALADRLHHLTLSLVLSLVSFDKRIHFKPSFWS